MRMARILLGVVVLAAVGWSAWWVVGSTAKEEAFAAWLADRRDEGWQAEAAAIETTGFPSRFDTRVTDLRLADPEQGWAWTTPFLDVLMLSYRPNAAVLALPPGQTVAAPGARARLDAAEMRGSIRFAPGTALALERLSIVAEELTLDAEAGWRAAARSLAAHLRESPPPATPEHGYELHVDAEQVRLPEPLLAAVDPAGALPDVFDRLVVDARAALETPLDRRAVEDGAPGARAISLRGFEARWGDLALNARGSVEADAEGYAEGELSIRAENWREMLRAAVRAGAIGADLADALEFGLGLLAGFSGGDVLEAPITFSGGRARIGPVPIGPAPRIASRR